MGDGDSGEIYPGCSRAGFYGIFEAHGAKARARRSDCVRRKRVMGKCLSMSFDSVCPLFVVVRLTDA